MTPAFAGGPEPDEPTSRWSLRASALARVAAVVAAALLLLVLALLALSGCSTPARYGLARSLYTAVDVADVALVWRLDEQCSQPCPTGDAACTARCDAAADAADPVERAIAVARRLVLSAIGALLAAEEDGEDPPDLRERLSCAAGALILATDALRVAEIRLPEAVEVGIGAILTWGGIARSQALDECRGLDDQQDGTSTHGETPPPGRDAGAAPSVGDGPAAPSGAVRDPWSGARRALAVQLAGAVHALDDGGVR